MACTKDIVGCLAEDRSSLKITIKAFKYALRNLHGSISVAFVSVVAATASTAKHAAAARLFDAARRHLRPREVDEHLLERGLADRVILDVQLVLHLFDFAEDLRPRDARGGNVVVQQVLVQIFQLGTGKRRLDIIHQRSDVRLIVVHERHASHERVAFTKLRLQMLLTAQTLELAIHHDTNISTKCFALFHTEIHDLIMMNLKAKFIPMKFHFDNIPMTHVIHYYVGRHLINLLLIVNHQFFF